MNECLFQDIYYVDNGGAISILSYDLILIEGNTFESIRMSPDYSGEVSKGGAIHMAG